MAKTIPHRELRNNSSKILRDVQQGETYEITNHGEVVAIISPPTTRPPLRVREAAVKGDYRSIRRVKLDHPVQETIDYLRGDH